MRHLHRNILYVKDMWKRITNPNLLIYLDASFETTCKRRKMDWIQDEYFEQKSRLSNARENADYYLDTTPLSTDEVLSFVQKYLEKAFP